MMAVYRIFLSNAFFGFSGFAKELHPVLIFLQALVTTISCISDFEQGGETAKK